MTKSLSNFGLQRIRSRNCNTKSWRELLFAKNPNPKPNEEMQPKVIKKTELEYQHKSYGYAIFGLFSLSWFCYKEQKWNSKKLITKNNRKQNQWRWTVVFFYYTWDWEVALEKRKYEYYETNRRSTQKTKTITYFRPNGFPLQRMKSLLW